MARWGSMLILPHHLWLDSLLPRAASQESNHEVGTDIYSFRANGEPEVKGAGLCTRESAGGLKLIWGGWSPPGCHTRRSTSCLFELCNLPPEPSISWDASNGPFLAENSAIGSCPRTISVMNQNLIDKAARQKHEQVFRKLRFPLQYCHHTGDTATPTM